MDPVGTGTAGGALGRILQSRGGVLFTSLAHQDGEISLHITCFTSPAYCLGSVSSTSALPARKTLQELVSLALGRFAALLLFSLLIFLLLHLIFNLRLQCSKKRHNAEDMDEATWSQSHTKSNKLLQYLLVRSTYCFTSFLDTSLTVKNNLTWQ